MFLEDVTVTFLWLALSLLSKVAEASEPRPGTKATKFGDACLRKMDRSQNFREDVLRSCMEWRWGALPVSLATMALWAVGAAPTQQFPVPAFPQCTRGLGHDLWVTSITHSHLLPHPSWSQTETL